MRISILAVSLSLATFAAPVSANNCPEIADFAVDDLYCATGSRGLVIAENPERAQTLLALAENGANRFEGMFAKQPVAYAIVDRAERGAER